MSTYPLAIEADCRRRRLSSHGSGGVGAEPGKLSRECTGTAWALGVARLPVGTPAGWASVPRPGGCAPPPLSPPSRVAFASPAPDLPGSLTLAQAAPLPICPLSFCTGPSFCPARLCARPHVTAPLAPAPLPVSFCARFDVPGTLTSLSGIQGGLCCLALAPLSPLWVPLLPSLGVCSPVLSCSLLPERALRWVSLGLGPPTLLEAPLSPAFLPSPALPRAQPGVG